jgi:dihydroorotase
MKREHLVLRGGRILCPASGVDTVDDLWICDGRVVAIGALPGGIVGREVDCSGAVVAPGFIDLGAELCDPGMCWREDLSSGSEAGAAGGFTTIVASPRTEPTIDTPVAVSDLLARAAAVTGARIEVAGALTLGLDGEDLSELGLMAEAGAIAFSDGRRTMMNAGVLRRALDYVRPFKRVVMVRPGDTALEAGGVMHEGRVSVCIGLRGIPAAAEEIGVARAVALARLTGARVHLSAVTTASAISLVRQAKASGLAISAAVPARNLCLTDEAVDLSVYDTATRLLPPLRGEADRLACLAAVRDGTIDCICADHVPHSRIEKEMEFMHAQPGAVGLESAFRAALTGLDGDISTVVSAMASGPAGVVGRVAEISVGACADIVVLDCEHLEVQGSNGRSKGMNEPLAGRLLRGLVRLTVRDGCIIYGPQAC